MALVAMVTAVVAVESFWGRSGSAVVSAVEGVKTVGEVGAEDSLVLLVPPEGVAMVCASFLWFPRATAVRRQDAPRSKVFAEITDSTNVA